MSKKPLLAKVVESDGEIAIIFATELLKACDFKVNEILEFKIIDDRNISIFRHKFIDNKTTDSSES